MKLKLAAESLLEWVGLKLNLAPRPFVETHLAFIAARAVMAGAELGLFEALGRDARTADEVARACQTHPAGTRHLLDCLVGIGYLRATGGRYSLRPVYRKWLLRESEANLIGKLRYQAFEWDRVGRLEGYVRTGRPLDVHGTASGAEWRLYQEAMRDVSINAARELARRIPVPAGAARMLDVGGSHGLYSIEVCKRHPGLVSTVLELPGAVESARAIARRYDTTGRVRHAAGDALADDLGTAEYDLVVANNVAHHFTAGQNRALAAKVARALKPGGAYAIGDLVRPDAPGKGGVVAATLDLYFALTSESGTWSAADMHGWQTAAGLTPARTLAPRSVPGWKMVVATKPKDR
jgi:SAM-dependent methyltransferase